MAVTKCINTVMWFDRDLLLAWKQVQGYTWNHMSKASGIRPDTLCSWSSGKSNPNMYQLLKLEQVSKIPLAAWVQGKDENQDARAVVNGALQALGEYPWL